MKNSSSTSSTASNRLVRRAIALSWFTIVYNLVEGAVSIAFGVSDDSVSLMGFGLDSLVEVASGAVVLWRFRGELGQHSVSRDRERRATRLIGWFFIVLGVGTAAASAVQLLKGAHPETSLPGFVVASISLTFMYFLWRAKYQVAVGLGSTTMKKDALCSAACIKLSVVLLLGSLLYMVAPALWWADGVAAMVLSVFIIKEGLETTGFIKGDCCTHECEEASK